MPRETVRDLLVGRLSEVYCAEHHALKARMSAASHERLVQLLGDHLDAVDWDLACLEDVFTILREGSCGATCDGTDFAGDLFDNPAIAGVPTAPVASDIAVATAAVEAAAARTMRAA